MLQQTVETGHRAPFYVPPSDPTIPRIDAMQLVLYVDFHSKGFSDISWHTAQVELHPSVDVGCPSATPRTGIGIDLRSLVD